MEQKTWTREQVNNAFKNLLLDSELFTPREEQDIRRLKMSNQELATLLGGKIEALKEENRKLRRDANKERRESPCLFDMQRFTIAPPDFAARYRKELLSN